MPVALPPGWGVRDAGVDRRSKRSKLERSDARSSGFDQSETVKASMCAST
jgi:hypothetical protein